MYLYLCVTLLFHQLKYQNVHALAGFGKNSVKGKGKKAAVKKGNSIKQSLLDGVERSKSVASSNKNNILSSSEPKLDRFGLPILTADDVFPPLSTEFKLVPCSTKNAPASIDEIQNILNSESRLSINENVCAKLGIKVNLLHVSPPVIEMENFFSADECDEYMEISKPGDEFDSRGALMVESPKFSTEALSRRTSTTWFCNYERVPSLLAKATNLLEKPLTHFEEPQVVR